MKDIYISKEDVKRRLCKASFYHFIKEFWTTISNEKPVWNWHIKVIADACQEIAVRVREEKIRLHDLLVNVPPGSTKSTIISVMFPVWIWVNQPDAKILGVSFTSSLAESHARKSINILSSNKFKELFPETYLTKDAVSEIINNQLGERHAIGISGSITGKHYHFILIDDPLDPLQAISEAELKAINNALEEVLPMRKINKEVSATVMVMQRLSQTDPSGRWLDNMKKGYKVKHICLPAELYSSEKTIDLVQPPELTRFYVNGMLDPVRLSRAITMDYETKLSGLAYSGQLLQSPISVAGGMFNPDLIKVPDTFPSEAQMVRIVRAWDKAYSKDKGDFTVGMKIGKDAAGRYYLLDMKRFREDSGARENLIKQTAIEDGVRTVVVVEQEPGGSGRDSANSTVRNLAEVGCKVIVVRAATSKTERADVCSTFVNRGLYFRSPALPHWGVIEDELKSFPNGRHDDIVDALSHAHTVANKPSLFVGGL